VLQLSLQRLQPKAVAAQAAVAAAERNVATAQAAYNKAHNIPEPTPVQPQALQEDVKEAAEGAEQHTSGAAQASQQQGAGVGTGAEPVLPTGGSQPPQEGNSATPLSTPTAPQAVTVTQPATGTVLQQLVDDESSDTSSGSSSWEEEEDTDDEGGETSGHCALSAGVAQEVLDAQHQPGSSGFNTSESEQLVVVQLPAHLCL
jgi:hypothetical protein